MCEQTIHTDRKIKFLTTKTSQKTQVYNCSCIHLQHNVLACFLLYFNNLVESCRLRHLNEFHVQLLLGVDMLPKILELCHLEGYV